VLGQHGIGPSIGNLDYWYPKDNKPNGQHICVVETFDTNTETWPEAASALWELLVAHGAYDVDKKIQVEIRNDWQMYSGYSQAIPDNPTLLDAIHQVEKPYLISFIRIWEPLGLPSRITCEGAIEPREVCLESGRLSCSANLAQGTDSAWSKTGSCRF
jgi:hypothetical protein